MVNRAILLGRLGKSPELKYTESGSPVCRISVATERKFKDGNGKTVKEVTWLQCVAWGSLAEACYNYLEKGRLVYIEGHIENREWEGDDGQRKKQTIIVCEDVRFIDRDAKREPTTTKEEDLPL